MIHLRFIFRQITTSPRQTAVFIACVALSLVTLISIGGFGESVNSALLRDARKLLAGDIVVQSRFPFSIELDQALSQLKTGQNTAVARTFEFITIVQAPQGEASLLSEIKAVDPGYPFYGQVLLESGRSFPNVLKSGQVIVGQNLLDRMELSIGDQIRVGDLQVRIADVVIGEPDQPVDFFSLGPRIFISTKDLESTGLIRPGSRVFYKALVQVNAEDQVDPVAEIIRSSADPQLVDVETYLTNQSTVQRFFEDFLTFLNLIGIFTLMLAGLGIQSSLTAFIREREETIAILRTFGASGRFLMVQFFVIAHILGLIGTVIGMVLGLILQALFPFIFGPFLPPQVEFILSGPAMVEGFVLGAFVVSVFTFLPIYRLQGVKPRNIFRKEAAERGSSSVVLFAEFLVLAFLAAMTFRYLQDYERTLYFSIGIVVTILLITGMGMGVLHILKGQRIKPLGARQALRGLFRPRNATLAIIVTLCTSLVVLFTIYLIERNVDASFVQAYPADSPNLFLLDIQPNQREDVKNFIDKDLEFVPIITARINAINGEMIDKNDQAESNFDRGRDPDAVPNLSDNFSLTYRSRLDDPEYLIAGEDLFLTEEVGSAQVSIFESIMQSYPFKIGDKIEFDIQGVMLEAEVVSIRAVDSDQEAFGPPLFAFVLRETDLAGAPQTIVTAVNIPRAEVSAFQNHLVSQFPNITVIDISAAIETLAGLVGDITTIIRFFTVFSLLAGALILISSILATRFARIQESVYFKILGARRQFVLKVFVMENMFLGLVSASIAVLLSQLVSWLLITKVFELSYKPYLGASLIVMGITVLLVVVIGIAASLSILSKKPITFMREQTVE